MIDLPSSQKNKIQTDHTALLGNARDLIDTHVLTPANLLNVLALYKEALNLLWIGFYWVDRERLKLGLFQGPVACLSIPFNKGVCGKAWAQEKTIMVDDVHQFDGHIACSSKSNSEMVIPIKKENKVIGVLDIDSEAYGFFDDSHKEGFEALIVLLLKKELI